MDVVQSFVVAIKCWSLLHSPRLERDYAELFRRWPIHEWAWLEDFEVDMLLYQGLHREAMIKLQSSLTSNKDNSKYREIRAHIQLTSCYCCLSDFSNAISTILYLIKMLPRGGSVLQSANHNQVKLGRSSKGRQLQLMSLVDSEILQFCVQSMISCLKNKVMTKLSADDSLLGHLIVLLQFDWPRYERTFCDVIKLIRHKGSFSYTPFFSYVINIDMLEEFAYLRTPAGGNINLTLATTSPVPLIQARTVTRGVNKGASEDFKVALEHQVTRCQENVSQLVTRFLLEESVSLISSLSH